MYILPMQDKQTAANLLQDQLAQIESLMKLTPDDPIFKLWREKTQTLFEEFFADKKDWISDLYYSKFIPMRIKYAEEDGIFTREDKEAYQSGLENAKVVLQAALEKLAIFGIKPKPVVDNSQKRGIAIQVVNSLSNSQSMNLIVTFEQIIQTIERQDASAEQKEEAKQKINNLKEELGKENPVWENIKAILIWLINFSKDVFIQVLPYILDMYTKKG